MSDISFSIFIPFSFSPSVVQNVHTLLGSEWSSSECTEALSTWQCFPMSYDRVAGKVSFLFVCAFSITYACFLSAPEGVVREWFKFSHLGILYTIAMTLLLL